MAQEKIFLVTLLVSLYQTYETESLWELFKEKGYERIDYKEFSDVYIVNTCTVTNSGDSKSRKAIRRLIKQNP